jgi:nuclease S1
VSAVAGPRSTHRSLIPIAFVMLLSAAPAPARAPGSAIARWWDLGHRVVARLAESRLTPHTREAVRDILDGQGLADASVWADNIRQYRHDADRLHYVNIPLADAVYDPARDCPHGQCIVAAIEHDRRVLADAGASPEERAEALRFLIHFMGDLHQPLHVADDGDRGGNSRAVIFLGHPTDLHKVWDGELIDSSGLSQADYVAYLRQRMQSLDLKALERGTVVDWAMEGHRIAAEHAYRLLADGRIGRDYLEANRPIVDHALIAGGVRLAKVLNEALASYRPSGDAAAPSTPGVYSDREAAAHLGETATVVGTIAAVFRSKTGTVYLNFGADYPHQTFTAVALAPAGAWTSGLDSLVGRRVGVHGTIVSYRGRVEIVLRSREQLVQAPPAATPAP